MELKDSGISWIGKIPANWDLTKLKTNFVYEKGKNAALYTKEYVGLHKGNYPVYSGQTEDCGIMGTIDTFDYDVDECVFSTTVGAKVMTPMLLSGKFSLSQNCLIMKPTGMYLCKMLYYCLDSLFDYERKLIPAYMQPSLRFSDLNKYCLPQPSIQEQEKIVDHLDKKCARIDSLVEKQRSIIEKLKEYKKSVITEAVTRGLNPTAPMKDSGIEWIGKIPAHWEARKIKNIFEIIGGNGFPDEIQGLESGEFPFCKCSDINSDEIYLDTAKNYVENDIITKYKLNVIPEYSILMSKIGEALKKNHRKINMVKCIVDNNMEALAPICNDYNILYLYFLTTTIDMMWFDNAGTIPSVNNNRLRNFMVCFPPLSEQQAIANYLDQMCGDIDSIVEKRKKMIDLLIEYKKSLIYECVTGKKEIA